MNQFKNSMSTLNLEMAISSERLINLKHKLPEMIIPQRVDKYKTDRDTLTNK